MSAPHAHSEHELIDVHCHVVPPGFPSDPSAGGNPRWPCLRLTAPDVGVIEIAGKAFRELDERSWNVTRRLADMDQAGISMQVLSPMPELLSYWFDAADGLSMARHVNHALASMVAQAPARLRALGMVPLQDVTLATTELARLAADGFSGVEIGSNVNGLTLGEARFDEFFAEAARLDLAVFVHALHPVGAERLSALPDLVPYAAFPLDTGLSAAALIRAGVLERHPTLRLGLSHGGGALVPLLHRLEHGWRVSSSFGGSLPQAPSVYAARLYYDSLVYDADYLTYLIEHVAPGQVFAGTDYPYAIEQRDLRGFIARLPTPHHASVSHACARRFLGGTG